MDALKRGQTDTIHDSTPFLGPRLFSSQSECVPFLMVPPRVIDFVSWISGKTTALDDSFDTKAPLVFFLYSLCQGHLVPASISAGLSVLSGKMTHLLILDSMDAWSSSQVFDVVY